MPCVVAGHSSSGRTSGPPLAFPEVCVFCALLAATAPIWAFLTFGLIAAGVSFEPAAAISGLICGAWILYGLMGTKPKPHKRPPSPPPQPKPKPSPPGPRLDPPKPKPVPKLELRPRTSSETLRREHFTALFLRDSGRCGICGQALEVPERRWGEIEIDHVHPHSEGGTDDRANLQLAHASCNASKGARTRNLRHPSLPKLPEGPSPPTR